MIWATPNSKNIQWTSGFLRSSLELVIYLPNIWRYMKLDDTNIMLSDIVYDYDNVSNI